MLCTSCFLPPTKNRPEPLPLSAVPEVLQLSDALRDDVLPELGVRLEDHEGVLRSAVSGDPMPQGVWGLGRTLCGACSEGHRESPGWATGSVFHGAPLSRVAGGFTSLGHLTSASCLWPGS